MDVRGWMNQKMENKRNFVAETEMDYEKIDASIIEALAKMINSAVCQHNMSIGTDRENICLLRMNFIKKFSDDVLFLDDLSGNKDFYHRYAYLIMRNMLEQLIEFLYVQKNRCLIDEYLGLKIDLEALREKRTPVEGERRLGKARYENRRPSIVDMAKGIDEYEASGMRATLYDVYSILSERAHNSYFGSLLDDFVSAKFNVPNIGLDRGQISVLNVMLAYVFDEYAEVASEAKD